MLIKFFMIQALLFAPQAILSEELNWDLLTQAIVNDNLNAIINDDSPEDNSEAENSFTDESHKTISLEGGIETFDELYVALYRADPEKFFATWDRLSDTAKKSVLEIVIDGEGTNLISYATYALPNYFEDSRQVSGAPIKAMCEVAPDILDVEFLDINTGMKETALSKALSYGFEDIARALLECGADASKTVALPLGDNRFQATPNLHWAAAMGSYEIFKVILESDGVDASEYDSKGNSVLRYALQGKFKKPGRDHEKIAAELKSRGLVQLTRFGCEVFHLKDVVPGVVSSQPVASVDSQIPWDLLPPKMSLSTTQLIEKTTNAGLEKCQQSGYSNCELIPTSIVSSKLESVTENPQISQVQETKTVNIGDSSSIVMRTFGFLRSVSDVYIVGLDQGVSADQCKWLL